MIGKIWSWLQKADRKGGYTCVGCGAELFIRPRAQLCQKCERELEPVGGKRCPHCGRQTLAEGTCLLCKAHAPVFRVGCSVFVYDGETASLINAMKRGVKRLALYFGETLAERLLEEYGDTLQEDEWLIVPVPLTDEVRKNRGFNQTELLVESMLPVLESGGVRLTADNEVLKKRRETSAQKELGAKSRKENVEGAYYAHKRKLCRGRKILLVDDVMTTGATGAECARVLLAAGAREVWFCSVASSPERR